jgi:hypothetical protein
VPKSRISETKSKHTKHLKPSMWNIVDKVHFKGNDLYVTVRIPLQAILRRVSIEQNGRKTVVRFNRRFVGNLGEL